MRYQGGSFVANAEADLLRWLAPDKARRLLTFAADRRIVDRFPARPVADAGVLLIRHGKAGKRSSGRRTTGCGRSTRTGGGRLRRSRRCGALFAPRGSARADLVRCEQTVAPLAQPSG